MRAAAIACIGVALLTAGARPAAAENAGPALATLDVRPVETPAASPFTALMQLGDAKAAARAGDWVRARALFETVLLSDPGLREARLGVAEAALALGDAVAVDQALEGMDAPVLRSLVDLQRGRLNDPETALRAAFARYRDPRLSNALGQWLDDRGRGPEARAAFRAGHDLQRAGVAHNNIGLSYLREGDLRRAQAAFDTAVRTDPADPLFSRNRRLCALMRGDYAAGLHGVAADEAAPLLREAGASALGRGELRLATLLLKRSDELAVRHDPRTAALRERLARRRALERDE